MSRMITKTLMLAALVAPLVASAPAFAQEAAQMSAEATMTQTDITAAPAKAWDAALGRYISAPDAMGVARFDYAALNNSADDKAVLVDYITYLEAQTPSTMTDAQAVSYWANLYNALTIRVIIDNYPVKSIREIKSGLFSIGPWGKKLTTVEGKRLTLDNIEHDIMRVKFPSPHVHYMVNCASVGCPNLKDSLWRAESMETERQQAARAFINSQRGVAVDGDALTVSSIYKWFKEDFGGDKAGALAHIREFADDDLAAAIDAGATIKGFDYDWSLNQ